MPRDHFRTADFVSETNMQEVISNSFKTLTKLSVLNYATAESIFLKYRQNTFSDLEKLKFIISR